LHVATFTQLIRITIIITIKITADAHLVSHRWHQPIFPLFFFFADSKLETLLLPSMLLMILLLPNKRAIRNETTKPRDDALKAASIQLHWQALRLGFSSHCAGTGARGIVGGREGGACTVCFRVSACVCGSRSSGGGASRRRIHAQHVTNKAQ
jgi:hypothetical protein